MKTQNARKRETGLARRHRRVRGKISGTAARPRMCVTRSNNNIYVQVIDDVAHKTICGVSTLGPEFKETGKKGSKHGKKAPDAKPLSPELRRDVQRQLHRMEHCVEAAFKALALCDMSRVKSLCDEARHYYQTTLMVPGFEGRKQKLKDRLTYCVKTWAATRREWMLRLCRVD